MEPDMHVHGTVDAIFDIWLMNPHLEVIFLDRYLTMIQDRANEDPGVLRSHQIRKG